MKTDRQQPVRIVVLGAGYSGLLCAIRLAHRTRGTGAAITLVNPSARFTERIRMHQLAAGQQLPDLRIPDLLRGSGVDFVQGRAVALDPTARRISVERAVGAAAVSTGEAVELSYDRLIYALGSSADTAAVPGADAYALTLDDPRAAQRFAARLAELTATTTTTTTTTVTATMTAADDRPAVTVVGAGLTGIEAAAEIAESHPEVHVTLLGRAAPGADLGDRARTHLLRTLDRLGVTVRTGSAVTRVLPGAVQLDGGELLRSDLCLWTAGTRVSPLAAEAGIETDARGLIVADASLRSVSHPEIRTVGDSAAVRLAWGQVRGSCQSGLPTGTHAADSVVRELRGKEARPLRFGYVQRMVSLGRHDAVTQFTRPDDSPRRAHLSGRTAVVYKELVVRSTITVLRLSKRANLSVTLSKGGRATRRPAVRHAE